MSKYAAFNQGKRFADTKARAGAAQSKYIGFVVLICELIKSPRFATKAQKSGARKISRADYNTSKDPNCKQRSAHSSKRAHRSYFTRHNSPIQSNNIHTTPAVRRKNKGRRHYYDLWSFPGPAPRSCRGNDLVREKTTHTSHTKPGGP
jgi:hypothetical protein